MVTVNEMLFGFMPEKRAVDAVFIFRRLQQDYCAKEGKLYLCSVDPETGDRVQMNVLEWMMREKRMSVFIK